MASEQSKRKIWIKRGGGIAVIVIVILLLLLLRACHSQSTSVTSATTLHPLDRAATLKLGDAITTGFSGVVKPDESAKRPAGKSVVDVTFIDVNGTSARIFDPGKPGSVWAGNYWAAPHTRDIPASAVGQVFGVALDDAAYPNTYLAATSLYGLNIVMPDKGSDADDLTEGVGSLPLRLKKGRADAEWMSGQFGPGGGPGSIWKIDGRTGKVTRFADISLGGEPTGPASLGNIAYDPVHHQLVVSDLSTGVIHRLGLNGKDLGLYDHGMTGRAAANLPTAKREPDLQADIRRDTFDPSNPQTWGFAPAARRVFGLEFNPVDHRLYYAVADGQIWSVGFDKDGEFANDSRVEVDIPEAAKGAPVSDLEFTRDGVMIAAQRGVVGTAYDYTPLAKTAVAHVWRYSPSKPFDPTKPRHYYQSPEEYAVGYAGDSRNSAGGVALGYGYKSDGTIDLDGCEDAIYFTGDMLRDFHQTQTGIEPGGPLELYGLQISPKGLVRGFNVPPDISYFVNYGDTMGSANSTGTVGDVIVYRIDCKDVACESEPDGSVVSAPVGPTGTPGHPETPPNTTDTPTGSTDCVGPDCGSACTGPNCNPPCTGPNCNPPCTGPNCNPPCTGPNCNPPCTGPNCNPPCIGPDCNPPCIGPDCNPVEPQACMVVKGTAVCDPESGGWVFKIISQDHSGVGIDTLAVESTTPGVTVSNGPNISLVPAPGLISLGGATPGQVVSVDVCGFDSAARDSGKPYDCCRTTLVVRVPRRQCPASVPDKPPRN